MGKGKELSKIAGAVEHILGDKVKKKKIKKDKALKRFIKKMENRRKEVKKELDKGGLKNEREKLLRDHLDTLDAQIKKASKILAEM